MGCCMSTSSNNISASSPTKDKDPEPPRSSISRVKSTERRGPPLLEEETVKKVLSETLKAEKLPPPQNPTAKTLTFDKFEREIKNEKKKALTTIINKAEEISQVSEVCSLSETTVTETREEEHRQVKTLKRVNKSPARTQKNRSFSGDLSRNRERVVGKSPARVVHGRDQMGNGRRSRSPATRTDSVGRIPSARRRTNQSPARVRTAAAENGGRKMENSTVEGKWPSSNESLENPLVSLECFIFL